MPFSLPQSVSQPDEERVKTDGQLPDCKIIFCTAAKIQCMISDRGRGLLSSKEELPVEKKSWGVPEVYLVAEAGADTPVCPIRKVCFVERRGRLSTYGRGV